MTAPPMTARPGPSLRTRGQRWVAACLLLCVRTGQAAERPQLPAEGFIPLVAVAVSDQHKDNDFDWEHTLHNSFTGRPLVGSAETNYAIGILDTGASADLIGKADSQRLGVWPAYFSGNFTTVQGAGGQLNVRLSKPMGVFAQGVGAIDAAGRLDLSRLVGHGNNVAMLMPPNDGVPGVTSTLVGIPFLAFYNTIIRNDIKHTVEFHGAPRVTPDVEIVDPLDFDPAVLDNYTRSIPLAFGPIATTASYFGLNFGNPFDTSPQTPTLLSIFPSTLPTGGGFFANVNLGHGELSPTNPVREYRMLFDTGADVSIISRAVAANLNLNLRHPDFTMDIEAIGGNLKNVPGFYVDFARINASGGAMEWERVPFFVLDLQSPEGGALQGILGMNFFWNRNLVFEPSLIGSTFVHVSDPLFGAEVLLGDVDLDLDRDADDIDLLRVRRGGDFHQAPLAIFDLNRDALVDESDVLYFVRGLLGTEVGDINLDGRVDIVDFNALKRGFGSAGGWADGELDGEEGIGLEDFFLLKLSFGFVSEVSSGVVPEPAGMRLATVALSLGLLVAARRRYSPRFRGMIVTTLSWRR